MFPIWEQVVPILCGADPLLAGFNDFAGGIAPPIVAPSSASAQHAFRNPIVSARLTLVLGGARSGKSRYAETLVTKLPPPWIYLATGQALDAEMAARIEAHRARRGAGWTTVEAPRELAGALAAHAQAPILVDCLTLWLSNLMMVDARIDAELDRLELALAEANAPIVMVANEVGSGIVPDNALARRFRDLQGVLNQRIAARADHVVLVVAGLPLVVKGRPT
jgi:adenosylcobinamide kinase / adenosylcobinamide-phosphate guanylyltransferase